MSYIDYRFKFADLPMALSAMQELRTIGILSSAGLPQNMLGDPRDAAGNVVPSGSPDTAFSGRRGSPASSYVDEISGQTVQVFARGDPGFWYIGIRSSVPPSEITFDPATYGLVATDPDESAAVLGVWA